jgi:hypothetical protein
MARNVRVVTGPRPTGEIERAQEFADALMARSLRPRGPEQRGPVQVTMSPWEGVAQLGEAFLARKATNYADKLAEAEQERLRAANEQLVGQLGGYKDAPRRIEDRAPMANFGQPTGAPIDLPEDMRVPTERAEKLAAAIAGMDLGTANAALSGVSLQRLLADPEAEEAYTLTPGSARYKGDRMITERPTEAKQPGLPEGMRMNPQTGQPEWIPGYLEAKERLAAAGRSSTNITYDPDGSNRYGAPPPGMYRPDPSKPNVAPMPGGPVELAAEKDRELALDRAGTAASDAENAKLAIKTAKGLVNWRTTGLVGQILGGIGGTRALDLREAIKPIQSNVAFSRLQRMREESKTGGALGQVAVKELELLMSTIQSLNADQSDDQLLQNLELVDQYYDRAIFAYQAMLNEQQGGQRDPPQQGNMVPVESRVNSYLQQAGQ